MNTLLENNLNKLLEEFLLVENLSFFEDICSNYRQTNNLLNEYETI